DGVGLRGGRAGTDSVRGGWIRRDRTRHPVEAVAARPHLGGELVELAQRGELGTVDTDHDRERRDRRLARLADAAVAEPGLADRDARRGRHSVVVWLHTALIEQRHQRLVQRAARPADRTLAELGAAHATPHWAFCADTSRRTP